MAQEEHWGDTFIYNISRIAVIIPILIIISGVSLKFLGYDLPSTQTQSVATNTLSPTQAPTNINNPFSQTLQTNASEQHLDLKGPWACQHSYQGGVVQAYIKESNIFLSVPSGPEVKILIVNGNCLYSWSSSAKTGLKNCNISSWISMAQLLLQFNSPQQLFSVLSGSSFGSLIPTTQVSSLSEITKSCKKEDFDEEVFRVPKNIVFVEPTSVPTAQ